MRDTQRDIQFFGSLSAFKVLTDAKGLVSLRGSLGVRLRRVNGQLLRVAVSPCERDLSSLPADMRDATDALRRTIALLERGRQEGLHLGAQLYVSLGGEPIADMAMGEARPGVPMRPDTLTLWFSAGKPITAVAVAQLCESNRVSMEDQVARFVPEFAMGGKAEITVRHLLTHTGGFRDADKLPDDLPWEEMIARICATPLERGWTPGQKAGYHLFSSWFMLGEMVRRIDGRPIDRYAREMILDPLDMHDSWLGVPVERLANYGDRIGSVFLSTAGRLAPYSQWNSPQAIAAHRPGSNVRGPIRELARFYESLLAIVPPRASGPAAILKPESVRNLISRQRSGLFDHTFRHTLDFGLGFLLNSNRYGAETVPYGYGRHATECTFGHSGSQSSCAFVDPAHLLVVAWACNGLPGESRHQKRAREINTAIYEDLGLAAASA